jgi:hypothetical protein
MKSFLLLLMSVVAVRAELLHGHVELTALKGAITAKSSSGQEIRQLKAGDLLREDEELKTPVGGSAELQFSNGMRILVAPATKLSLAFFRQVKTSQPSHLRESGELPGDGSVVDLLLGGGHVTIVCPALESRSQVSVRTPQGRADLTREGVYELIYGPTPEGELLAQVFVLAGYLHFTPAVNSHGRSVKVEASNKLSVTSDAANPTQLVLEKLKMESSEVVARLKGIVLEPPLEWFFPFLPKAEPVSTPALSQGASGLQPGLTASEEAMRRVTQEILERQAQTNPSPTGG